MRHIRDIEVLISASKSILAGTQYSLHLLIAQLLTKLASMAQSGVEFFV